MTEKKRTFNNGDRESRRRTAERRLRTENPQCIFDNVTDAHCCQLHHVGQHQQSDETAIVCSNHHDKLSNAQKDHPPKIEGCTDSRESIGHVVLGLAEMLYVGAEMLNGADSARLLKYVGDMLWDIGITLIEQARVATANGAAGPVS